MSQVRSLYGLPIYGPLAQSVERRTFNPQVAGSNPAGSTKLKETILAKSNRYAGQFDLKGKKYLLLRCRCCAVENFKYKIESKRIKKELNTSLV